MRSIIRAKFMAWQGKLCSNCAWHGRFSDRWCGFSYPSCNCPKWLIIKVDPFKGIKKVFPNGRPYDCKDAYGKFGCRWKEKSSTN